MHLEAVIKQVLRCTWTPRSSELRDTHGGRNPVSVDMHFEALIMQTCISKKHFRPGGMAPSEWTRSVRAVRDTPVADYSGPGVNTTHHAAYCPLIAVSPFLLTLSVYTKYTLYLSHLLISLALATILWIYAIAWILAAG